MDRVVWLMLTIPIGTFFICFGIYAWKRKANVVLVGKRGQRK